MDEPIKNRLSKFGIDPDKLTLEILTSKVPNTFFRPYHSDYFTWAAVPRDHNRWDVLLFKNDIALSNNVFMCFGYTGIENGIMEMLHWLLKSTNIDIGQLNSLTIQESDKLCFERRKKSANKLEEKLIQEAADWVLKIRNGESCYDGIDIMAQAMKNYQNILLDEPEFKRCKPINIHTWESTPGRISIGIGDRGDTCTAIIYLKN